MQDAAEYQWPDWPAVRLRRDLTARDGVPVSFCYQLEYDLLATLDGNAPHDWRQVARFDHDITGPHNLANEPPHLDLYKDGEKFKTVEDFPRVPLKQTPGFCRRYLQKNRDVLIRQFERWHDVTRPRL